MPKTVLFYREFLNFSGGHLKVYDYFCHAKTSESFQPKVFFTKSSDLSDRNPWLQDRDENSVCFVDRFVPESADVLFFAGQDWLALPESQRRHPPCPVINLIQHIRHADPSDCRFSFLEHPATRVCVSQEVADAIVSSGRANGPVVTIANGLDYSVFPHGVAEDERTQDVMIVGIKQLPMAQQLCRRLRKSNVAVDLLDRNVSRAEFLRRLSEAKVAVFLPDPTEGFYLPPLEAMFLSTFVICPDCHGNRVFCHDGTNCLQPRLAVRDLHRACNAVLAMSQTERRVFLGAGEKTARKHGIIGERSAFLEILNTQG